MTISATETQTMELAKVLHVSDADAMQLREYLSALPNYKRVEVYTILKKGFYFPFKPKVSDENADAILEE